MLTVARHSDAESIAADVKAVAGGDREAFTRVYAAYGRMVRAVLLGRVPRRDVDDLLQDVFVTAYLRIAELREPAAFGGWIATIARNRATDHLRRSRDHVLIGFQVDDGICAGLRDHRRTLGSREGDERECRNAE